jgi:2-amino-4-hydroxy-6-hydroxymethyldihydropteridine diphosphokinase
VRILIGLGGNEGDVRSAFDRAAAALADAGAVLARSSLYRTTAIGPPQPDYLNAALLLDTPMPPLGLLSACQAIEREVGRDRDREARWGPRPLDLDLLLADGLVHRSPSLVLPHLRLEERAFALVPAAEIAPGWRHPVTGATLEEMARRVGREGAATVDRIGAWA